LVKQIKKPCERILKSALGYPNLSHAKVQFIDFHINNGTKIYIKLIPLTFILSPVVGGEGRVRGDVLK
jgi:hypothetical protein